VLKGTSNESLPRSDASIGVNGLALGGRAGCIGTSGLDDENGSCDDDEPDD
jgi:hypothetical protein